jgi:hypothetical protein
MATIYGPQAGHATLDDTLGDDTIIAAGGYNTIDSLYGNDTISAGSIGYNTILAGTQYDQSHRDVSIRVNGLGNTIDGGDDYHPISRPCSPSQIVFATGRPVGREVKHFKPPKWRPYYASGPVRSLSFQK